MQQLGETIKGLRAEHGWTQKELAALAGTTEGYMRHIEKGRRLPSTQLLMALARVFNVSFLDLFPNDPAGDLWAEIQRAERRDAALAHVNESAVGEAPPSIEPAGEVYYRRKDAPTELLVQLPAAVLQALVAAGPRLTAADWARIIGYVERLAEERGG